MSFHQGSVEFLVELEKMMTMTEVWRSFLDILYVLVANSYCSLVHMAPVSVMELAYQSLQSNCVVSDLELYAQLFYGPIEPTWILHPQRLYGGRNYNRNHGQCPACSSADHPRNAMNVQVSADF